jgi:hypothetical protein
MKPLLLAALLLSQVSEHPKPNIREEQQVVANGVAETGVLNGRVRRIRNVTPATRAQSLAPVMALHTASPAISTSFASEPA